jgi:hypothetical protein
MFFTHARDQRTAGALFTRWRTVAIFLSYIILSPSAAAAEQDHKYVGHLKCKKCHEKKETGDQYSVWLESDHAKAYQSLASEKARRWGAEAGVEDPKTDEKCIKCHSTAYAVPEKRIPRKFDRTAGVQCEGCHGAGKDYSRTKIMIERDVAIANGLVPQNEAVCTPCHNEESPGWDPERYTLADGSKTGFNYELALKKIVHPVSD